MVKKTKTEVIEEFDMDPSEWHRSDHEVWEAAFESDDGEAIKALFNGEMSAYEGDHDKADQALVNALAYWTDADPVQMDRMFRSSGLMRRIWDKKQGVNSYGDKVIIRALEDYNKEIKEDLKPNIENSVVDFEEPEEPKGGNGDDEEPKVESDGELKFEGDIDQKSEDVEELKVETDISSKSTRDEVGFYISRGEMRRDLLKYKENEEIKTGFSRLDKLIGALLPGIYATGAVSASGKTTLFEQISVQMAVSGQSVIYFSMEQSKLELVTKGISRITAKNNMRNQFHGAVSAIDIRRGQAGYDVERATREYERSIGDKLYIVECSFEYSAEDLCNYVTNWMKEHPGIRPIVIVDYLQILRPINPWGGAKEAVDDNLRKLKMIQRDNRLVMFLICSLNRNSYLAPVDFESFKESGAIEYTSDVVWGLQPSIMDEEKYRTEKDLAKKRKMIKEARAEFPRKVKLTCLKNRFGNPNYEVKFKYYPEFDFFIPDDEFSPVFDEPFT